MTRYLFVIPFGKYKGKGIEDVESGYLHWLLEQEWFCTKFQTGVNAIEKELKYRRNFLNEDNDDV